MTLDQILSTIRQKGIVLEVQGDNLAYESPRGVMTQELVESIRTHKQEIITILSGEIASNLEGRPNWCIKCPHGGYKISEENTEVLWCNFANQEVLDMQKCAKGYWVKNGRGLPVTMH